LKFGDLGEYEAKLRGKPELEIRAWVSYGSNSSIEVFSDEISPKRNDIEGVEYSYTNDIFTWNIVSHMKHGDKYIIGINEKDGGNSRSESKDLHYCYNGTDFIKNISFPNYQKNDDFVEWQEVLFWDMKYEFSVGHQFRFGINITE
jgi:hypothetical protein